MRRVLAVLATLLRECDELHVLSELSARLTAAAGERGVAAPEVAQVLAAVRRADGWTKASGSGSAKVLVRPKAWLRAPALAEARLDDAARAVMGPFLPVDEKAMAAALGCT
jgi:hypothetical protein